MGNTVISSAILDRLLHHNHVLNIREEICQPREKRQAGLLPPTDCQPLTPGEAGRQLLRLAKSVSNCPVGQF